VTDSSAPSQTATRVLSIVVVAQLKVTSGNLAAGTVAETYSQTLAATGGTTPYTWTLASGTLPPGLTLAASTGRITGTPTTVGTFSFTARVTDAGPPVQTVTKSFSIKITVLAVTTTSLPGGTRGAAYSQTVKASGGTTPYSWSVVPGSLPPGLSLAPSTGKITGTPTTAGTYGFTVKVTDSGSPAQSATKALSIKIS
jgi:Putative Ig domain